MGAEIMKNRDAWIAAAMAGGAIIAASLAKMEDGREGIFLRLMSTEPEGAEAPTGSGFIEFFPVQSLTTMQNECLRIIEQNMRTHFPELQGRQALILGIIERESSFRPRAVRFEAHLNDSSVGLMQLLTRTAHWLGHNGSLEDLYHPETNIYYGMKFLSWLRDRCVNDQICMIHSYNVGFAGFSRGRRNNVYFERVTTSEKRFSEILNKSRRL